MCVHDKELDFGFQLLTVYRQYKEDKEKKKIKKQHVHMVSANIFIIIIRKKKYSSSCKTMFIVIIIFINDYTFVQIN